MKEKVVFWLSKIQLLLGEATSKIVCTNKLLLFVKFVRLLDYSLKTAQ
jgi:hypothetical protein